MGNERNDSDGFGGRTHGIVPDGSGDKARCNPSLQELAVMPDYRRKLKLAYWAGDDRPSEIEIADAVAATIQHEFEMIRDKAVDRYIYFVQAETGQIKIGIASNVKKRFGNLQGASPVKLTLLFSIRGGASGEYKLHHKFRDHRLHGEWFAPHPDLMAEIERLRELP